MAQSLAILRGLRLRFEKHHAVHISDAALEAAVTLSDRSGVGGGQGKRLDGGGGGGQAKGGGWTEAGGGGGQTWPGGEGGRGRGGLSH